MGETSDVLLVQINPLKRAGRATTAAEITDRANDLTFNASLIAQMRSIALLNELVAHGMTGEGLKPVHMHRIDGGSAEPPTTVRLSVTGFNPEVSSAFSSPSQIVGTPAATVTFSSTIRCARLSPSSRGPGRISRAPTAAAA